MIKTPLSTMIGGAFWTPKVTILGGASNTFSQLIKSLFANNEQGFFYDPNDLSTMYQDSAGTVPVTGVGQAVGLMLDKSKGLALSNELVTNGDFSNGLSGWTPNASATVSNTNQELIVTTTGTSGALGLFFPTVAGKRYKLTAKVVSTNVPAGIRIFETSTTTIYDTDYIAAGRVISASFVATTTTTQVYLRSTGAGVAVWDNISVKELSGNHAYQTTSSMRPLLVASSQRLDFDIVDDKLITNLPAQLTGCTVIRSVPNVGTQILTNQTIPATYNDNTDHCGLIVINRALTATETSQITKLFNRAAGV